MADNRSSGFALRQRKGIWQWASNGQHSKPDAVMACCGHTPTLEVLAAVSILPAALSEIRLRVVNVVDLIKLQPRTELPHGMSDTGYDSLFTHDRPVVFAFHSYPGLVQRLIYHRTNRQMHVRGYGSRG